MKAAAAEFDSIRDAWRVAGRTRTLEPFRPVARAGLVRRLRRKARHLSGSFAMIRLVDHSIVVSLRQAKESCLERFATEILATDRPPRLMPGRSTDNRTAHRAEAPTKECSP